MFLWNKSKSRRLTSTFFTITSQWGFTRPSSIYFNLGIRRDIVPLVVQVLWDPGLDLPPIRLFVCLSLHLSVGPSLMLLPNTRGPDDKASCPIGLAHLILFLLVLLVRFAIILFHFLVTCTRLYTPVCRSVGRSVGRLVGRSVGRSVGPLFTFSAFFRFLGSQLLPKCQYKSF